MKENKTEGRSITQIKSDIEKTRLTIDQYTNQLEDLQDELIQAQQKKFDRLHEELGMESKEELLEALGVKTGRAKRTTQRSGRGNRIPDEVRSQVEEALKEGETGVSIARRFGVSLPWLQGVKKELGLVKPRK